MATVHRYEPGQWWPGDRYRQYGPGPGLSEYEQVPWARALKGVGEGRYDVLINAWYSKERTQLGQFSNEYLVNRIMFLKHRGSPITYDNLSQLYDYPIAVVRGYAYSDEFDADAQLRKVPVHNFAMAVRMLAAERVKLTRRSSDLDTGRRICGALPPQQ